MWETEFPAALALRLSSSERSCEQQKLTAMAADAHGPSLFHLAMVRKSRLQSIRVGLFASFFLGIWSFQSVYEAKFVAAARCVQ